MKASISLPLMLIRNRLLLDMLLQDEQTLNQNFFGALTRMSYDDFLDDEPLSESPVIVRRRRRYDDLFVWFSPLAFGLILGAAGLFGGFMYGDSWGRKHAQYDNSELRDHYAGQCYTYWEKQFKQTVRLALERPSPQSQEQNLRLAEIRGVLLDMQQSMAELAAQKTAKAKGKMAENRIP